MKKLGLLLMLFTFAACTNDDFSVLQENEEITLPTAVTRASGDKLYDLLGYGYDVTGHDYTLRIYGLLAGAVICSLVFYKNHRNRTFRRGFLQ